MHKKNAKSFMTLFILALVVVSLVWFGVMPSSEDASVIEQDHAPLMKVATVTSEAHLHPLSLFLHGQSAPSQTVILTPEITGKVARIATKAGVFVKAGTPLVVIAPEHRNAAYISARSALVKAQHKFQSSKALQQKNVLSEGGLKEAKAQYKKAQADLKKAEFTLQKTDVVAPFDGRVNKYEVEVGSYLDSHAPNGSVVGVFVRLSPLKVITNISQFDYDDVHLGQSVDVVFANGVHAKGEISFVASIADINTRTFQVDVLVKNEGAAIPAGMSADVALLKKKVPAHEIATNLLSLSDTGELGVKTVDTHSKVQFHPIKILQTTPASFIVAGIPETAHIISVGHAFVKQGETVAPHLQEKG